MRMKLTSSESGDMINFLRGCGVCVQSKPNDEKLLSKLLMP